jgi:hypothetical protein
MFNKASQKPKPAEWRRRMHKRFMDLDGGLHAAGGSNRIELTQLEELARQFDQVREAVLGGNAQGNFSQQQSGRARPKRQVFGQR